MVRPIPAAIESESAKRRLHVLDLVRVRFPDPIGQVFWGNVKYTYGGNDYLPRVISVGSWSRTMSAETEDLSITLGNVDGELTRINNIIDVELAELSLIRVYPDLDDAIDPLWTGYGGTLSINETTADWSVHFGFRGFTQKGIRKFAQNCWKQFADNHYCPYTGSGVGLASNLASAMGPGSTTMTVLDGTRYEPGDVVKIDGEQMLVLTKTETTFDVNRGHNATLITDHAAGTAVFHANCQKSAADCDRRGMNGPPEGGADFRYFGGWDIRVPVTFKQRNKMGSKPKFFQQSSYGNENLLGENIPVVWGNARLRGIPAAASVDAKEFRHSLFLICEGPIYGIPAGGAKVNDLYPDDTPNSDASGFDPRTQDSYIFWRGDIGQRQSKAVWSDKWIDTYNDNPYLFNSSDGDGPSLSDIAVLRIRIEEGGEEFSNDMPSLDLAVTGRLTRPIESYIAADPSNVTNLPNPIEVAADYLVNGKFGARLDESRIEWNSAQEMSWYCQEPVTNTAREFQILNTTVMYSAASPGVAGNSPKTWALLNFNVHPNLMQISDGQLTGRTLKVLAAGKEQSYTIAHNFRVMKIDVSSDNRFIKFGFSRDVTLPTDPATVEGVLIHLVEINGEWDSGKIPTNGDTVQVTGYHGFDIVPRFRFDGVLHDDDSVEQQLAMILENCNGFYFARGSKIVFGIKKAENLATVDALPILTDHGPNRNILRNNGVSTLSIKRLSSMDAVANQIEVLFEDAENGFQEAKIFIYDEDLQLHTGEVISGDKTRIVTSKNARLIGTSTKDQAMRLGAIRLREEALKQDNCAFSMSLKDSLLLEPGDVRRLESYKIDGDDDKQLSRWFEYIRIVKIEETDKFTATIEAHRHDNGVYDDTIHNLVTRTGSTGAENPANFPLDVIPFQPVETIEYAKDGSTLSIINVEVTYP